MSVDSIISDLKLHLKASTDSELASALGIEHSAIAQWRRRGHVPKKYHSPERLRPVLFADDIVFRDLRAARDLWRQACELAESNGIISDHLRAALPAFDAAIERECTLAESREMLSDTCVFGSTARLYQ